MYVVVGIWVSVVVVFLIVIGLFWVNVWGGYFVGICVVIGIIDGLVDWVVVGKVKGVFDEYVEYCGMVMMLVVMWVGEFDWVVVVVVLFGIVGLVLIVLL